MRIILIGIGLALVGCSNPALDPSLERSEMDTVRFELRDVSKKIGSCADPSGQFCATISLSHLDVDHAPDGTSSFLDSLIGYYRKTSFANQESYANQNALIDSFLKEYQTITEEFPDYSTGWEYKATSRSTYNKNGLLGLSFSEYRYSGGAHGLYTMHFVLADLLLQKTLTWRNLVDPRFHDNFIYTAEMKFKRMHEIPDSASLVANGFWFGNDVFTLPNNVRIDQTGMIFFWNAMEIKDYASGSDELLFTWDEMKPFLFPDYAFLAHEN